MLTVLQACATSYTVTVRCDEVDRDQIESAPVQVRAVFLTEDKAKTLAGSLTKEQQPSPEAIGRFFNDSGPLYESVDPLDIRRANVKIGPEMPEVLSSWRNHLGNDANVVILVLANALGTHPRRPVVGLFDSKSNPNPKLELRLGFKDGRFEFLRRTSETPR